MMLFKTRKKKAFSLTESMIMLTIMAIAVASLTPMITKKIANNAEAGTTINGVSHGRYEIYAKEIVTFGPDSYEKTSREKSDGVDNNTVLVFERLDDLEYKKYANKSPEMNSKGQKSTLYEQIENAKPYRTPDGNIEYVEFEKGGVKSKHTVGGKIILEGSNTMYVKGKIIPGNPDTFEKDNSGVILPNATHRIIEGVLVKEFNKKSDDNNILWHIDAKNDSDDNFEGTVTVIPWEKVISGKDIIVNRPIPKDPDTGKYIGTFDPGLGTKSLVLHAVGGGGAGGGIKNIGGSITPKNATDEEIGYMKQTLAKSFKAVAAAKGLSSEANINIDTLVKVVNTPELYKKSYEEQFDSDNTYIVINKADGTVTIKVDTQNGLIFPHELLEYTKTLGSQTQDADIFKMPPWGTFETILTGGDRGKPFYAGGTVCGGAGGAGGTYQIESMEEDMDCKRASFCSFSSQTDTYPWHCTRHETSCSTDERGRESCHEYCAAGHNDHSIKCEYTCDGTQYNNPANDNYYTCPNVPFICPALPIKNKHFLGASCRHTMRGGAGGAAPPCATACTLVSGPIREITMSCSGSGSAGSGRPNPVMLNDTVTVTSGTKGTSCFVAAGGHMASSLGGEGGKPCMKTEIDITFDMADSSNPAAALFGQTFNAAVAAVGAQAAAISAMNAVQSAYGQPGVMSAMVIGMYTGAAIGYSLAYQGVDVHANPNGTISVVGHDQIQTVKSTAAAYDAVANLRSTSQYAADESMACMAPACAGITCGAAGAAGSASNDCADDTGICTDCDHIKNNHIYSWTFPFAMNRLSYGEAGQPGEYKTTKIAQSTAPIKITLGLGGIWTDHKDTTNGKWVKGIRGLDGTDTIIEMDGRNILTAKGGKGGTQDLYTYRYNLCYANAGTCTQGGKNIDCCDNEIGKRSTKEILTTASKMSAFENIKALTGNSVIIGIGLGRGGEGAGTRAGVEQLKGLRVFRNSSGYNVSYGDSQIKKEEGEYMTDVTAENLAKFKNYALAPSGLNFKGGDGAVIITW